MIMDAVCKTCKGPFRKNRKHQLFCCKMCRTTHWYVKGSGLGQMLAQENEPAPAVVLETPDPGPQKDSPSEMLRKLGYIS